MHIFTSLDIRIRQCLPPMTIRMTWYAIDNMTRTSDAWILYGSYYENLMDEWSLWRVTFRAKQLRTKTDNLECNIVRSEMNVDNLKCKIISYLLVLKCYCFYSCLFSSCTNNVFAWEFENVILYKQKFCLVSSYFVFFCFANSY